MNKRRLFSLLTALLMILATAAPAFAVQSDDNTLKVAYYPLEGFFEYDNSGNEIGYGVELLNKISQYTGLHFEYVPAESWESTKPMLLDGEADIRMPATAPSTPSTTLSYSQHSILDTYYAVLALNSRQDLIYNDYDKLSTLKVGISESLYNSAHIEAYISEAAISTDQLVFFDGYAPAEAALKSGEVDAIISNIMDMTSDMKQLARFSTVSNFISMTLDNPQLSVLNDALSRITIEEPTFLPDLYKKWFPERVNVPLTKDEINYLRQLDGICFSFRNEQGYLSRKDENGKFVGFYPSLAQYLCQTLDVNYEETDYMGDDIKGITVYPDFYYDYTWAENLGVDITSPYYTINYFELSRKNSPVNTAKQKVAAVKHFRITNDLIGSKFDEDHILWCDNYYECIEAVYSGKADITYVNSYTAEYYLSLYRYSNLVSSLTDYSNQVCFAVYGDDSGLLASALSKILSGLTSDQLQELMIESVSVIPEQNLLVEWIYESPVRSIVIISLIAALLIFLMSIIISTSKIHHQSLMLAKASSARQDFLSRMSHDMRTPMNAIIGYSDFGTEAETLDEAREYHEKIHKVGNYLLQLINDSLDLSKLETGKYVLSPEPCSYSEFTSSLNNILLPKAKEKNITLKIICSGCPENQVILFDKMRLQQIFVNLLNNSIKFTPDGGNVSLDIKVSEQRGNRRTIVFTVRDDGVGMSKEFVDTRLFMPFEQEHPENAESGNGTGLGLSIVKQLTETMGGLIKCDSAPGKGTVFTVIISAPVMDINAEDTDASDEITSDFGGKRVLLCEDHPMNREIANKLLERVGLTVENAENGKIGVEMFERSAPGYYSGVLMDIRMPVLDGLDATRAIRRLDRPDAASVPIIAMSANALPEDVRASLDSGMNAHVSKPIDVKLLMQTLSKWIK